MATISIETMRKELILYYKKRGWNTYRVSWMPDKQLKAVYLRYSQLGFPVPAKETKKEKTEEQLSFFD